MTTIEQEAEKLAAAIEKHRELTRGMATFFDSDLYAALTRWRERPQLMPLDNLRALAEREGP